MMMLGSFFRGCQKNVVSSSVSFRHISTAIRNNSNQDYDEPQHVVYPKIKLPSKIVLPGLPTEEPWTRVKKVMKFDYDTAVANLQGKPPPPFPGNADILIIGGGIVGSSIAYHLSERTGPGLKVTVVEKNPPKISNCSSDLYHQVGSMPNFEMTQYAAEFYRTLGLTWDDPDLPPLPDIGFNVNSSLLIAPKDKTDIIDDLSDMYKTTKWNHQMLSSQILKQKFPWLNSDGIVLGCLGMHKEGFFNESCALAIIRAKARRNGVTFQQGNVVGFEFVDVSDLASPMHHLIKTYTPRTAVIYDPEGDAKRLSFGYAVLAAGNSINEVASLLRINNQDTDLPLISQKLSTFEIQSNSGPGLDMPLIMDPSGLRVRRNGLLGTYSVWNEKDLVDHASDEEPIVDNNYFNEELYPKLIHRIPDFKDCKVISSKAQIVDKCLWDNHLLLGPLIRYPNILVAGGFCNNRYLFAPAIGRGLAEHMLDSQYSGIDLSCFRLERIVNELKINTAQI
ncbi:FAD-dependent oxidoreductase domain-containing protein 1 [Frankliniella occidentalis]|uniref:FAD-dependent oxidoreductase domain-containing protein 1 n=1 Tax=Frankliniella occidentalis TaxID=133901 RepID=A0A9C6X6P1_FRAOC|nr:FAD-dependent oxidoreductase domain-containing protein 1 [Frankliniella occidentalis]